jgi:hypothetical protein
VLDCYWYYIDFLIFTELKEVIDRMHTLVSFVSGSFIHVQYSSPAVQRHFQIDSVPAKIFRQLIQVL